MGRVRRRLAAWLALASLAIQLVATTGHFHREDFAPYRSAPEMAAAGGGAIATPPGGAGAAFPSHDDCALCFSLKIAGNSTLAAAGMMAMPKASDAIRPAKLPELRLAPAPYLLFQTRAPPIA